MSLPDFPTVLGYESKVAIAPIWSTIKQTATSGRTVKVQNYSTPLHRITITPVTFPAIQFGLWAQHFNAVGGRSGNFNYKSIYLAYNSGTGVYSYAATPNNTTFAIPVEYDMDDWEFETECYGLWTTKSITLMQVRS